MSILTRYVLRAHVAPAAAGLAIFYFVLSMDFIVDYLNLFITKGVPGTAVLEAFTLSLAWMTVLAVPMALMVSVLTAFGRLSGDNEITAIKSTGVNVFSLIMPVLVVAGLAAGGLFLFGNHVLPAANYRLKSLLVDIHRVRPLATIEPGVLTELPGGYRILVDRLDPKTSEIFGVMIHRIEGGEPLQTILAKRGHVESAEAQSLLRIELYDGEIDELDPEDPTRYNRLLFERHVINIQESATALVRSERTKRGDREMSVAELSEGISRFDAEAEESRRKAAALLRSRLDAVLVAAYGPDSAAGAAPAAPPTPVLAGPDRITRDAESALRGAASQSMQARRMAVEYHKKFSIPFSCIVFVLLGAPLGIRARRGGVGIGAGVGILFFLVYYLFLIGGEELGDRGIVSAAWAMWAPNVLFGALGVFLTLSTAFEWGARPMTRIIDFVLRPPAPGSPAGGDA
jgi:lipopolysaccharide export system permease protein